MALKRSKTVPVKFVEAILGQVGAYDAVASASHRFLKPRLVERRQQLLAFHAALVARGNLVFDVGANDGRLTRIYRRLGARVVEPNPVLAAQIERRYRIPVVAAAAGAGEGEADLHVASVEQLATLSTEWIATAKSHGIATEWTGDVIRVPVITVDSLIADYGIPDYLKIDVEGYEEHVLAGLSRSVRLVCFEFQVANAGAAEACVQRLEQLGRYEYRHTVLEECTFIGGWSSADRVRGWLDHTHAVHGVAANGNVFARLA